MTFFIVSLMDFGSGAIVILPSSYLKTGSLPTKSIHFATTRKSKESSLKLKVKLLQIKISKVSAIPPAA